MRKIIAIVTSSLVCLFLTVVPTFAHVVVKPNQVGVGAFQTFTMGVPNEKDNPTVSLRLIIPEDLNYVSPNVKPGWTINIKKSGDSDDAKITEIDWTEGSIPVGQRDDFYFSAQVPAQETTINWKAYQTYEDGSVVSWDQDPKSMANLDDDQKEENEKKGLGPYSQTQVVNDLADSNNSVQNGSGQSNNITTNSNFPTVVSIAAIALSVVAFAVTTKKK